MTAWFEAYFGEQTKGGWILKEGANATYVRRIMHEAGMPSKNYKRRPESPASHYLSLFPLRREIFIKPCQDILQIMAAVASTSTDAEATTITIIIISLLVQATIAICSNNGQWQWIIILIITHSHSASLTMIRSSCLIIIQAHNNSNSRCILSLIQPLIIRIVIIIINTVVAKFKSLQSITIILWRVVDFNNSNKRNNNCRSP